MPIINCLNLWTGIGEVLSDVSVDIDDSGIITSISKCKTQVYDYSFCMPSFVDAHVHYGWMIVKQSSLDLSHIKSSNEFLEFIESAISSSKHSLLRGESYDESEWITADLPTLEQLDSVTGSTPVFFRRVCGHAAFVNSAMLRLFDSDIPGVNRVTGVLKEGIVLNFESFFPLPHGVLQDAGKRVEFEVFSRGVTAVYTFETEDTAQMVIDSNPEVNIKTSKIPVSVGNSCDFLSKTVKLFLDGSIGAGTAALSEKYSDGSRAPLFYSDAELFSILLEYGSAGSSVAVHAIGSRALQQIDRVSNQVFNKLGFGFPVRIEHAEDLIKTLPGKWNSEYHEFCMQPNFVERWQRAGGMYEKLISLDQAKKLNPFKSVLKAGFKLGFGSDCMPFDPLYGLMGAVNHPTAAESLSMNEALSAYTLGAASVAGFDELARPLDVGRLADMVFLSGNPFEGLEGIRVDATMKKGKIVFAKNSSVIK